LPLATFAPLPDAALRTVEARGAAVDAHRAIADP